MGVAVGIAVVLLLVGIGGGYFLGVYLNKTKTTTIQLTETGSSLLYPLMDNQWAPAYHAADSNVVISAASTGSGTGQTDAETALVNIGASDAYVVGASGYGPNTFGIVNVPVAFSAQLIYYNITGVTQNLNLNGTVLADIYAGTITSWDDPMIEAAQTSAVNTELNATSGHPIVPIVRSDSSGDTFLFSSLCARSDAAWPYPVSTTAFSSSHWTGESGNSGMAHAITHIGYTIAYIGISYKSDTGSFPYAAVGDNLSLSASGGVNPANYILPTPSTISQDADLALSHLEFTYEGLALSMILGGGYAGATNITLGSGGTNPTVAYPDPYPIVNMEYALIKTAPVASSVVTGSALAATVGFLQWAISTGNYAASPVGATSTYLTAVNFVPLTPTVVGYDQQVLAEVQT
jgi:phosphate transport system substrate-binding protein